MPAAAAPAGPPDLESARGRDLIRRAREIRRAAHVGMDAMARRLQIASRWETDPPPAMGCYPRTSGTPEFWVAVLDVLDREQASD
jgi:hypothetical protein